MAYYTQHLITILPRKKATVENFKRIAAAIKEVTGFGHFLIHNGVMDDSILNNGQGCEWYRLENVDKIAAKVPDLKICFQAIGMSHAWDDGGTSDEDWYENGEYFGSWSLTEEEFYRKYGRVYKECFSSDDEEVTRPKNVPWYATIY